MSVHSSYRLAFVRKLLSAYAKGHSCWQICNDFGLSETSFYAIICLYPKLKVDAKKRRDKFLSKQKLLMKKKSKEPKVKTVKKRKRTSSEEKVKQLESRLKREQLKNQELEKLLKVTKEVLGKY